MSLIRRHRPEALTNDGGVFIPLECFTIIKTFMKKYKMSLIRRHRPEAPFTNDGDIFIPL